MMMDYMEFLKKPIKCRACASTFSGRAFDADRDFWITRGHKSTSYWLGEIKDLADEIRREEAEDRARAREDMTVGPDAGTARTLRQIGSQRC